MISHQRAKRLVQERLDAEGVRLVAAYARREPRFAVWTVAPVAPDAPDDVLDGGGYVVTDDEQVHAVGSAPGELLNLMERLNRL